MPGLKSIFDTTIKTLDGKPFIWYEFMFFLKPASHTRFFSVKLELDTDPGYISLNINSISIGEIKTKGSPVCAIYITWESQCIKTIVARLL